MPGRRWVLTLVLGAAVALLAARGLARIYTDYLWYAALGAADVWRAKYWSLAALRTICATTGTLFAFANLYAVRQSVVSLVLPRRLGNLDIGEEVPKEQLTYAAAGAALVIGLALAWSRGDWSTYLAASAGQSFGESDPYFALDLSFFVHWLPLELSLFNWALVAVLSVIGLVVLLYALTPSLRWESGGLYVSGYVRRHLAMLAGALLLLLSWHYRLEMYTLLGRGSGLDGVFTYFDHRVGIPASLVMSVVTLGAGLTVLWAGWTGQMRLAFSALTGVLVSVLAARQVAPFIARRAVSDRDPVARERPYEATRAGYTRRAFAVDRVVTADSTLTYATLSQAAAFIPLWDDAALRRTVERAYAGASVAWQTQDSALIAAVSIVDGQTSAALFLPATVEEGGAPARVPRPDASSPPRILVVADTQARPIVIADSSGQVAAPGLSDGLSRLAYALAMQDLRVVTLHPAPSPKLVDRRTVRERLTALAPFFAQGTTITPVWVGDTLAWAVDMYSTSATYPLSRHVDLAGGSRAYFQHAATALVNAASGRAVLVADSVPDAVGAAWIARFPKLFVRPTALRAGVREQLPAARDGARAQAAALGRYGSRGGGEADVLRHLPDDEGPDSALAETPAPLTGFPRGGTAAWVAPLLDRQERVRGLFAALGGPSHRSLWLPAREPLVVWSESLDRLRAVDTITGPALVRGFVRAVPVGGRIVLIQPRYDWRGPTPRLLYVTAISGDSVRTARSVFQLAGRMPSTATVSTADFRTRVRDLYDEMRRASARGDWGTYGRAFDALGALLRQPYRR